MKTCSVSLWNRGGRQTKSRWQRHDRIRGVALFGLAVGLASCGAEDALVPEAKVKSLAAYSVTTPVSRGQIAFTRGRHIYLMNPDGSGQSNLTPEPGNGDGNGNWDPTWSPDARRIAFVTDRNGANYQIWVMNADGSAQTRLTSTGDAAIYNVQTPAWSPDGRKIAFSMEARSGWEIWVMNSDGTNQTRLTNAGGSEHYTYRDGNNDWHPAWSPDGSQLAFGRLTFPDGPYSHKAEIWIMNADGTSLRNVTEQRIGVVDWRPRWSPNGEKIVFESNRDGVFKIYVMNRNGTDQRNLTNDSAHRWNAAWSPDGGKIAFVSSPDYATGIFLMNADGSHQSRITSDSDDQPAWRPNPTHVDQCKDGGWRPFGFKTQGDCIQFANTGK